MCKYCLSFFIIINEFVKIFFFFDKINNNLINL